MDMYELYIIEALCLNMIYAWLNDIICEYEKVMETCKHNECEMHMLDHMMYDI